VVSMVIIDNRHHINHSQDLCGVYCQSIMTIGITSITLIDTSLAHSEGLSQDLCGV